MWNNSSVRPIQFRPWQEFFDVHAFTVPTKPAEVYDRVNMNLGYYSYNYLLILSITLLYVCFRHPWYILGFIFELSIFTYLFYYRKQPIVLLDRPVSRRDQAVGYAIVATVINLLFAGWTSVCTFAFAVTIILIHATFRSRSLKARGTAFIDMLTTKPHSDAPIHSSTSHNNIHDAFDSTASNHHHTNSNSSTIQPTSQQEQFKSQFRASMRAKYLRKT